MSKCNDVKLAEYRRGVGTEGGRSKRERRLGLQTRHIIQVTAHADQGESDITSLEIEVMKLLS